MLQRRNGTRLEGDDSVLRPVDLQSTVLALGHPDDELGPRELEPRGV